jgi:hypothetical protein
MDWDIRRMIFFDIETTGFDINSKFICSVSFIPEKTGSVTFADKSIKDLYKNYYQENPDDYLLITYNGENYYSGFDFPFLRTKFANKEIDWPFKGWEHLDVFPLIKKYFNTNLKYIKYPSQSSLRKTDLIKLAETNNIEYSTVPETYNELMKLEKINWLDYLEEETKSYNDLQSVYQIFFDPDKKEEYIDGGEVPELYQQNEIEKIIRHCQNDVERLYKITKKLLYYLPNYEIDRAINIL